MEGFDPISMTYMATNFETGDHTAPPPPPDMYTNMMMMPNDFMEQYSTYDTQTVYQGYLEIKICLVFIAYALTVVATETNITGYRRHKRRLH